MHRFDSNWLSALTFIAGCISEWKLIVQLMDHDRVAPSPIDKPLKLMFLKSVERLKDAAAELGMGGPKKIAKDAFDGCAAILAGPIQDVWGLRQLVSHGDRLLHAFMGELEGHLMFVVTPARAGLLQSPEERFGEEVAIAFPSAAHDIREAGKCFALERYTACVFHCMRTMEAGLAKLTKALSLDLSSNWNNALNQIEKEIRSRNAGAHSSGWKQDETFFSESAAHFRVVKDAWRNHTMHGHEIFDERRARAIYDNIAALMRHLAKRLSEENKI